MRKSTHWVFTNATERDAFGTAQGVAANDIALLETTRVLYYFDGAVWQLLPISPSNTLAGVLAAGYVTGPNDILVSNNQAVIGEDGGSVSFEVGTGKVLITSTVIGDPGTESAGVTLNGLLAESSFFVSDIGGTHVAQALLHRHSDTIAPGILTTRTRGNTSVHTVLQDNDILLSMIAAGYDGADYARGGEVRFEVEGTPGNDDMPTAYIVMLSPVGSHTPVERLHLHANGVMHLTAALEVIGVIASATANGATAIIGDGSGHRGITVFTDNASQGGVYFTDTAATHQGAFRYDHATDRMHVDVAGSSRAYLSSTAFSPTSNGTHELGLTATRWTSGWFTGSVYVAAGVTGHAAEASSLSIGDGVAAGAGATFYASAASAIYFADTVGGSQGGFIYIHASDTLTFRAAAADRVALSSTTFRPSSNNTFDLGQSANRWRTGYFGTSVVTTAVQSYDFGVGSGAGSLLDIRSGDGGTTGGVGAALSIRAGNAQSGNTSGGALSLTGGGSSGNVDAPNITINSGAVGTGKLGVIQTNTGIELAEFAAMPGATVGPAKGRIWVSSTTPSSGMFSDDDGHHVDFTRMPSFHIGVGSARLSTTNPATYAETGGTMPVINFANAVAAQSAHWWVQIPRNYLGGNLTMTMWWTGTTASAITNVAWRIGFDRAVAARDLSIDNASYVSFTAAGPSAIYQLKSTSVTLSNADMNSMQAGDLVRIMLTRFGNDATDTYTGAAMLLGISFAP